MVTFEPKQHRYHNDAGEEYISVTTLIHKYVPEFDSDYWSPYKAIKDVLSNHDEQLWVNFKRNAGGWDKAVAAYRNSGIVTIPEFVEEINEKQAGYLVSWKKINEESTERGTKIHNQFEDLVDNNTAIEYEHGVVHVSQENILEVQAFDRNTVHTELLIFNDRYKIAGQADRVVRRGQYVDISDYKTNKKLTYEGFRGETLKYPLDHIQNANFPIYELQLSLYAWMLEQCGYIARNLEILYIQGENDELVTPYEVQYRKHDVELLIRDYAETNDREF